MSDHHRFAADWLSLREPADHAARSEALFTTLRRHLERRVINRRALRIVDLGAGSGSNLRWLSPRLPQAQHWTLVDRDAALLKRARAQGLQPEHPRRIDLETVEADLADSTLPWIAEADLVTAAAFFDLVSEPWVKRLSSACAQAGAATLFVLSVDGRWQLIDTDGGSIMNEDDFCVQRLFNQHQRRDKGLGAALGPDAAAVLAGSLAEHGLEVATQPSDWNLPAGQPLTLTLGRELISGWCRAALEQAPSAAKRIEDWHSARQSGLAEGRIGLRVGHQDVLALPAMP